MRLAIFALSLTLLCGCGHFKKEAAAEQVPVAESSGPVAATGEVCSGIASIPCAEGLSCIFAPGVCNSMADATGTCIKPPEICTREYMPVCGCDGKTYGNKCGALAAGASVAHVGKCAGSGAE